MISKSTLIALSGELDSLAASLAEHGCEPAEVEALWATLAQIRTLLED